LELSSRVIWPEENGNPTARPNLDPGEQKEEAQWKVIGRPVEYDDILRHLALEEENLTKGKDHFVGVSRFLRRLSMVHGYSYDSCRIKLRELEGLGRVQVYKTPNPFSERDTAAVKTVKDSPGTEG